MDPEALFWQQRYLELLQNHTQIVALLTQFKKDNLQTQQTKRTEALTVLGDALKKKREQAEGDGGESDYSGEPSLVVAGEPGSSSRRSRGGGVPPSKPTSSVPAPTSD